MGKRRRYDRYRELRKELYAQEIYDHDIAEALGRSSGYVSERQRGVKEWLLSDAYKIMDIIGQPHDQIFKFFPPAQ